MRRAVRQKLLALPLVAALAIGTYTVVGSFDGGEDTVSAEACAPGFAPVDQVLNEIRGEMGAEHAGADAGEEAEREEAARETRAEGESEVTTS